MVAIASDHGGFDLKEGIIKHLKERGILVEDCGCFSKESCDYPDYAKKVTSKILAKEVKFGILVCGTGIGMSIAANKVDNIRAALCGDCFSAEATRLHNNTNVLCLGARVVGDQLAYKIVDTFLDTDFSNEERHIRRIALLESSCNCE